MEKFIIEGGHRLEGTLRVGGMKNAATPILAATMLTDEPCVIRNVPAIADVEKILSLLRSLGASVDRESDVVSVTTKALHLDHLDGKTVQSMRSSILFLGPLLARFHEVELPLPGGCIIGNRPIDDHLIALEQLGAQIEEHSRTIRLRTSGLRGGSVVLPQFSVTATENALLAAVTAKGRTVIDIAAAEPNVQDLVTCLIGMGARITGAGTHQLTIDGVTELHGAEHTIIPDQIEIGTFASAAAVTRGRITIEPVVSEHLKLIRLKLQQIGILAAVTGSSLRVEPSASLKAFRLQTMPYPGFPTDLQAPFAVIATQAQGTTLIHDPLYEGRMGYVAELVKMGANAVVCDPHRVLITGPTPLYGEEIRSFDLRAGATLIIAALVAKGQTVIHDAQVVDRGYEAIERRLQSLGADIRRVRE